MKVGFLKLAEKELDDAFEYYESEQPGLGFRFQTEVAHSLSRIIEYPLSYQEVGKYSRITCAWKDTGMGGAERAFHQD